MSLFVDTGVWYAAADRADAHNERAKRILSGAEEPLVTSDHVLLEVWYLLRARGSWSVAETVVEDVRKVARVACVRQADLDAALEIGRRFPDQDFSLTDRTSFAVMLRLGLTRVASFDQDFSVFRFGPAGRRAFQVIR